MQLLIDFEESVAIEAFMIFMMINRCNHESYTNHKTELISIE